MNRSYPWFRFAVAAALLTLLPLPLVAQESKVFQQGNGWVEETTGSLSGAHSLRAAFRMGSVHITGSAQPNITYTIRKTVRTGDEAEARRQFARIRIVVRGADPAVISTQVQGENVRHMSVVADIAVPRDLASVSVDSGGGDLAVSNLTGSVNAQSGGGTVNVQNISGAVNASTGGGAIHVSNVGEIKLSTGGGSIDVQGATGTMSASTGGGSVHIVNAGQNAVVETGGGGIDADKCGGSLKASTGGGSIDIAEVNGPATLETGGGSIRLGAARGPVKATTGGGSIQLWKLSSGAHAETGAGSITAQFIATRGNFASSSLESGAGDIVVYLPADLPVSVMAHIEAAMGHSIVSEFPELKVSSEGGPYGPRDVTATGTLNGGGPSLRIETNLGSIQIRKLQR